MMPSLRTPNPSVVALAVMSLSTACIQVTVNNVNGGTGDAGTGNPGSSGIRAGDAACGPDITVVPPRPTDGITLVGNLDQMAFAMAFDPSNPKGTSNFTASVTVYDSLGKAIQLDIYFCKDDPATVAPPTDSGNWTYHVMTDGKNLSANAAGAMTTPGTPAEVATGDLRFDTQGRLISNTTSVNSFSPRDSVAPQVLTFNFGTGTDPTTTNGSGLDGLTQYAATSAIRFASQTGSPFIACP